MSLANELIKFIKKSPSAYHTVATVKEALVARGYTEISESNLPAFSDGGKHFVIRGGTSIIAFRGSGDGFMVCSSHSDFPAFKIKCELDGGLYARCATESYGGMIYYTWFDRPLSVAGRVVVSTEDGVSVRLVNIDKNALVIPSVAIHMNRGVNDGYKFNPATDLLPLAGTLASRGALMQAVAESAGCRVEDIVSHDLFLYNRDEGCVVGINDELVLSPRIDDLGCVYTSVGAFLKARNSKNSIPVLAIFDNEEVGSSTKQGANSTFLDMTLAAIAGSRAQYAKMLANSFMVSADNAHAVHPNHPELADSSNMPKLSEGVVVKYNANQRYTTDAVSDAVFRKIAARSGAKVQSYSNRADMPGGSTLGSICNTRVGISTVDIGLPQLAMHSACETCAAEDLNDMVKILCEFYASSLKADGNDIRIIK